jgi:hypothetical protein
VAGWQLGCVHAHWAKSKIPKHVCPLLHNGGVHGLADWCIFAFDGFVAWKSQLASLQMCIWQICKFLVGGYVCLWLVIFVVV